jgi:hypothetical protein
MFSPYFLAKVEEKKKQREGPGAKRDAISSAIGHHYYYWGHREEPDLPLDPRWLDVAVETKDLNLVWRLIRPGHARANAFLKETFDAVIKKSKSLDECHEVVAAMVKAKHPEATDAFLAAFEKHSKKADYYVYWFGRLIPELPPSAVPQLEALVPKLSDKVADSLLGYIQQLREKKAS